MCSSRRQSLGLSMYQRISFVQFLNVSQGIITTAFLAEIHRKDWLAGCLCG
jgi:hypothetical protein